MVLQAWNTYYLGLYRKVCQLLLCDIILNVILKYKGIEESYQVHLQSPNSSHSDFLVSWGNTDLGSFIINLARNECFDFWHTINQRGQTISLNAPLEVLQFFGYCSVSCTSIMLTALLVKLKLELTSIIKRSLHRDEPAAHFKMLITLTLFSNINKRSLFFNSFPKHFI